MAWENRGNGRFYYRKVRYGNQIKSEYIGNSETAVFLAGLDTIEQEQKEAERQALKRLIVDNKAIDQKLDEVERLVREMATAVLLANGYHTHKGKWRYARN